MITQIELCIRELDKLVAEAMVEHSTYSVPFQKMRNDLIWLYRELIAYE